MTDSLGVREGYPSALCLGFRCTLYTTNLHERSQNSRFFKHPPPLFETPCKKFFVVYFYELYGLHLRKIMAMNIEPELGIPLTDEVKGVDLPDRVEALDNTVNKLEEEGVDTTPDAIDEEVAATLLTAYAQDPDTTSKQVTHKRAATLTPPSIKLANAIIKEFNHSVVESSMQLRHLVTNKLIIESDSPDAKTRMRALELLGKISDVGLFTEKSEVTITHQTTDDIKEKLRAKLAKIVNPEEEIEDAVVLDGEPLDVDSILGEFDDD